MSAKRPLAEAHAASSSSSAKRSRPEEVCVSDGGAAPREVCHALFQRFLGEEVAESEAFELISKDGKAFRAHSYVLQLYPYFKALLGGGFDAPSSLQVGVDAKLLAGVLKFLCAFVMNSVAGVARGSEGSA